MARVTGIGGIFFKARDAGALRSWYERHLKFETDQYGGWSFLWRDLDNPNRLGRTVFSLFEENTTYFAPSQARFMVNYRVDNLDELLTELRQAGVRVEDRVEEYDYGRFAWVLDPEGNKIELWEPRGEQEQ